MHAQMAGLSRIVSAFSQLQSTTVAAYAREMRDAPTRVTENRATESAAVEENAAPPASCARPQKLRHQGGVRDGERAIDGRGTSRALDGRSTLLRRAIKRTPVPHAVKRAKHDFVE
jgi:hypothetical protein